MHGNGKGSKRKALEMGRKFDQEWRIVSVSRLTGGKDRHSKVLTTKGLRDRRVRLSLPTAIQLYDLQERLGYEQPSKAIDWLIKAAKSAIDELPVLDPQISSPSAGNVAPSNSSNYSNVDHCVVSPGESATAVNAPALKALKVSVGSGTAQGRNFRKAINAKATSITTQKGSDLVRSSSSISDGSTKGSVEHISNSSMSEPNYMIEPKLKAYELGIEKFISDKTSGGSTPAVHQMNSMQPFLTSCLFNNPFPYSVLPFESQCCKDDNPCGIHTQILSRIGNVQQLWDYNNRPSYMDMLYTQESQLFRNLASSSTAPVQKSFPPVQSTLASIRDLTGTSSLQSYEKADSAISFFDPEQSRPFGGNAEQGLNVGLNVELACNFNFQTQKVSSSISFSVSSTWRYRCKTVKIDL